MSQRVHAAIASIGLVLLVGLGVFVDQFSRRSRESRPTNQVAAPARQPGQTPAKKSPSQPQAATPPRPVGEVGAQPTAPQAQATPPMPSTDRSIAPQEQPAPRQAGPAIRSEMAFLGEEPLPVFANLVLALGAPATADESPVTGGELKALLDDRRVEVYWPELLKYASPQSKKLQKAEHKSFIPIFMKPEKLDAGAAFLSGYATMLAAAEQRYGVPPKDVVAVLMWESNLGKTTGKFGVVNVYLGQLLYMKKAAADAERAMTEPLPPDDRARHDKRLERIKKNAERNLTALLRSSKAKGQDPLTIQGSWGGAIGFPQFMPTSFRYAVDADGDGKIDLYGFPDSIASIANYLSENGYRKSRAKAIRAYNPEDDYVRGVQMYADAVAGRSR